MRFNSLQDWLNWQESLNPKTIDLGLDRVQAVLESLQLSNNFICPVITVAGTNGKGSSVAMLEAILRAAGYSVGCYTSPHLFSYNERIRVNGNTIDEPGLCAAFEQVDQARGNIELTYFEFGTLAALVVFAGMKPDVVVLEVGLGGRLDAVNVIHPDVALVTTVDLDHTDWLGSDIETIAIEKAGIFRRHRPAIYAGLNAPESLINTAIEKAAELLLAGRDFIYRGTHANSWQFHGPGVHYAELPVPALKGRFQLQNAAGVIMALHSLADQLPLGLAAIRTGLEQVHLIGRFQLLGSAPRIIVDVAHNAQAARALAGLLADEPVEGKTLAVIAMLSDKAIDEVVTALAPCVDSWFTAGLEVPRGLSATLMAKAVNDYAPGAKLSAHNSVTEACEQALQAAVDHDRIIILGSFYTVSQATDYLQTLLR